MKIKVIFKIVLCLVVILAILICSIPVSANEVSVSAKAYVVLNADTFEILSSKNAAARMSMASTTKLMTALILAEQRTPFKQIVATKEMVTVEGSSMGLLEGDTVSHYALMVGMMLSSGNDAANVAAISVAGSVENFAVLMNKRAKEIGMVNTNFVTPSGLDDDNHYSTAYDMSLLAVEVLKNETLSKIVASESMTVSYGNPPYDRRLYNHNRLLSTYDGAIGLKTGFTKKSGRCLVSAARRDGCTVIAVTLNAPDDWNDHKKLLDFGLSQLESVDLTYKFQDDTMPVVGSYAGRIRIGVDSFVCGCTNVSKDNVTAKLYLKPFVYTPVKYGQVVGRVDYVYCGKVIHSSDVYSLADLELHNTKNRSLKDIFINSLKSLLSYFL